MLVEVYDKQVSEWCFVTSITLPVVITYTAAEVTTCIEYGLLAQYPEVVFVGETI